MEFERAPALNLFCCDCVFCRGILLEESSREEKELRSDLAKLNQDEERTTIWYNVKIQQIHVGYTEQIFRDWDL